mmetsp:Transcript_5805/g.9969  ORF Transcript_5805/g.9969 Transcript_5805/m.9969 type:complete len:109 (-) Transcript_5805:152-478(-)
MVIKGENKRAKRKRVVEARAVDQIYEDLRDPRRQSQPIDDDLLGLGQHYCIHCAKYFGTAEVLTNHYKTKAHKKREKILKEKPYSQEDADRAAGMGGTDNGKRQKLIL